MTKKRFFSPLTSNALPDSIVSVTNSRPINRESGYLYFEVSPWHRDECYYLKIRSRGTMRAIDHWLDTLSNWSGIGCVTHLP